MTALQIIGIVLGSLGTYLTLAIVGWRLGYVSGYEAYADNPRRFMSYQTAEGIATIRGVVCAVACPVAVPVMLIGKYATPIPPSVARELQDENARRIAELERNLGIGP